MLRRRKSGGRGISLIPFQRRREGGRMQKRPIRRGRISKAASGASASLHLFLLRRRFSFSLLLEGAPPSHRCSCQCQLNISSDVTEAPLATIHRLCRVYYCYVIRRFLGNPESWTPESPPHAHGVLQFSKGQVATEKKCRQLGRQLLLSKSGLRRKTEFMGLNGKIR